MPNKTLTVNLDPRAEAKLSGFFDGLTANLRIVTEEYERVLCYFQQANKAKRQARRELLERDAECARLKYVLGGIVWGGFLDDVTAAHVKQLGVDFKTQLEAEREACAQVVKKAKVTGLGPSGADFNADLDKIADAIRARGEIQETSPTSQPLDS